MSKSENPSHRYRYIWKVLFVKQIAQKSKIADQTKPNWTWTVPHWSWSSCPAALTAAVWIIISEFLLILIAPNNWVLDAASAFCRQFVCRAQAQALTQTWPADCSGPRECVSVCVCVWVWVWARPAFIFVTNILFQCHIFYLLLSLGCLRFASVLLFYCIVYAAESKLCLVGGGGGGIALRPKSKQNSKSNEVVVVVVIAVVAAFVFVLDLQGEELLDQNKA